MRPVSDVHRVDPHWQSPVFGAEPSITEQKSMADAETTLKRAFEKQYMPLNALQESVSPQAQDTVFGVTPST